MPTFGTFTDSRDGHVYKTVLMPDGKWWFAENFAWTGIGQDVLGNSANRAVYGRWYSQAEAITYAPTGCHLPTQAEATSMLSTFGIIHNSSDPSSLIGVAAVRDSTYWESNQGTNTSGFGARPAATNFISGSFGLTASFITSTGLQTNYTAFRFSFNLIDQALLSGGGGVDYSSVRFIVDSGNIPDTAPPPAFYGNPFEGFEAGTVSVEIDRKLTLVDTLGGRPVLIPYAPADKDEWLVTAEFWTSAEQAREIEMRTPPRGAPVYPGISVPARYGENTFAGLAPAATNGSADTYIDPIMLQPLEVLGQKDVRVDLYGYRASFSLSCSSVSNPYSSNLATAPTTTPPAWLPNKWRVHSIEDGSNERRVIGPDGKWTGSGNPIAANQIRPLSIQCDYLTTDQANELVAFFRGIRGYLFNLGFYPGPVGAHAPVNPDFVATKLTCKRDAGLLWSATLEVIAA